MGAEYTPEHSRTLDEPVLDGTEAAGTNPDRPEVAP